MGTYTEIQEYIAREYGVTVKTCWIAHVKATYGLTRGPAYNRAGPQRANPCPPTYWYMIEDALRHFGMIS